jgi:hypothetical protein
MHKEFYIDLASQHNELGAETTPDCNALRLNKGTPRQLLAPSCQATCSALDQFILCVLCRTAMPWIVAGAAPLLLLLLPLPLLLLLLLLLQALRRAQQTLLEDITGTSLQLHSTAAGADELASAFSSLKAKGPLLLLVDNVPEDEGGISKMLPDLKASLPDG